MTRLQADQSYKERLSQLIKETNQTTRALSNQCDNSVTASTVCTWINGGNQFRLSHYSLEAVCAMTGNRHTPETLEIYLDTGTVADENLVRKITEMKNNYVQGLEQLLKQLQSA